MKDKKFDLLSVVLVLFLVSTPIVMYTLQIINQKANKYINISNKIAQLEIINSDLNYFYLKKGNFINYDDINNKIDRFNQILTSVKMDIKDDFLANQYLSSLQKIEDNFKKSRYFIEHIKSYNSLINYTLKYLYDLKNSIKKENFLSEYEYELFENSLFLIMKYYLSIDDKKEILSSLDSIKEVLIDKDNSKLKYFYIHEKEILDRIIFLKKEKKIIENFNLQDSLEKLNQDIQLSSHKYLMIGRIIKNILIIVIMLLLPIILYLHRRSLKDKDSLISYKFAIENSDNSIVITDLDSNIIFVNEAFERETGYKKDEVLGKNPNILQSGLMQDEHYKDIYHDLTHKRKWEGEFVNKRKDGTIFYEKASIVPIVVDDKVTSYLAIKLNITDYIEQEKRVEFMAYHDVLTSLPNRLSFERYFENEIIKKDKEVSLFYMDLDRFKNINDSLGHHVGDELLKVFAKRLKNIVGKNNFIARLGGDEFVAVIDNFMQNEIFELATKIVDSFLEEIVVEGHILNVTTSIGIARYPQDAKTLEELMMYADSAMYEAKRSGKNQFQFFTKELFTLINQKLEIEQELRNALEKGELYLMYQPKYSLESGRIVGFEALVRWENEKLGFIPPDKFITIAEEIGLIDDIGYFVFESACRDFKYIKQIDPSIRGMAINVSPLQLKDVDFIDNINAICQKLNISQTGIELEVTETYLMEDIERNLEVLYDLRECGYKVAIDDFGTGYSSFAYLKQMPVNTLKIDKSFVDDICLNRKDRDIAKAIIDLANNLGFNIVAEGIEYKEQEELLAKLGADMGQGYLFSKPLKLNDLIVFVKEKISVKDMV